MRKKKCIWKLCLLQILLAALRLTRAVHINVKQLIGANSFPYPLSCWILIYYAFANSVDPDQWASEEANWSESALFAIMYVIYSNNPIQVIWLAEKQKWAWQFKWNPFKSKNYVKGS